MVEIPESASDELERLRRLESLVSSSPVGIWQTNDMGQLVFVNDACFALAGNLDPDDPTNSWVACIHPDDREEVLDAWFRAFEHGEPFDMEYRFLHPDGRVVWVYVQTAVAERDGFIGTATDVTDRRELASQLEKRRRLETVGRLAGGVAHDLNNLLTVIACNGDLLHRGGGAEELEAIERATERAAQVTSQLLAIARSAGARARPIELSGLLHDSSRLLKSLVGERMAYDTDIAKSLHPVRADPADVYRVLANLVANASDAMDDGGRVRVHVRNAHVHRADESRVLEGRLGPQVLIEVSDTGRGMDPQTLECMFAPGFTTKAPGRGTGLGLSAVLDLVERLEGTIEVLSTPGTGTTVRVFLPRADDEPDRAGPREEAPHGNGERILVVEDDDDVRLAIDRALRPCGYALHLAARSRDALALVRDLGHPIDLIVTDVVMPEENGPEFIRRYENEFGPVRALYVSGYAPPSVDTAAFHGVGRAFLGKPFTQPRLLRAVRALIDAPSPLPSGETQEAR